LTDGENEFQFRTLLSNPNGETLLSGYFYSSYPGDRYFEAVPGTYTLVASNPYLSNIESASVSLKVWKTIASPTITPEEEEFDHPFTIGFTDIPEGASVYYCVSTRGNWNYEYVLYDPQHPATINSGATVEAYCVKETANGRLQSETVQMWYNPNIDYPNLSFYDTSSIVERVPIPNTEVKLCSGDNTWLETTREDSS
ncbi:MAG: hypothetical protein J5885_05795, partial [Clostridia bacterium]|nr:hypothetical protein [Clostridia bacterium]